MRVAPHVMRVAPPLVTNRFDHSVPELRVSVERGDRGQREGQSLEGDHASCNICSMYATNPSPTPESASSVVLSFSHNEVQ